MLKLTELKSRISDVGKMLGGMKMFGCRAIVINSIKRMMYKVAVPAALYGPET